MIQQDKNSEDKQSNDSQRKFNTHMQMRDIHRRKSDIKWKIWINKVYHMINKIKPVIIPICYIREVVIQGNFGNIFL